MIDIKFTNGRAIFINCDTTFYNVKKNDLYIYETLENGNYKLRYIIKNWKNRKED